MRGYKTVGTPLASPYEEYALTLQYSEVQTILAALEYYASGRARDGLDVPRRAHEMIHALATLDIE